MMGNVPPSPEVESLEGEKSASPTPATRAAEPIASASPSNLASAPPPAATAARLPEQSTTQAAGSQPPAQEKPTKRGATQQVDGFYELHSPTAPGLSEAIAEAPSDAKRTAASASSPRPLAASTEKAATTPPRSPGTRGIQPQRCRRCSRGRYFGSGEVQAVGWASRQRDDPCDLRNKWKRDVKHGDGCPVRADSRRQLRRPWPFAALAFPLFAGHHPASPSHSRSSRRNRSANPMAARSLARS